MNDPIYKAQAYEIAKIASNISALKFQNSMLREQLQYELQTSRSRLESIDLLKEKNAKLRELAENLLMGFIYLETPQWQQDCIDRALHLRHELGVLPMEKLNAYELGIEVD